jgi:UTP--glucose-1-phosphate uridylyltransferase
MGAKAAILAAGYGTRFLPVTRTVPKEMLPLVDRPSIALVVDELVDAGVTEILVVTSRRKKALDDWFDRDPELEAAVSDSPAKAALTRPPAASVTFVRQGEMRGTGHAVALCREFAGDDPLVVAFPDDLFPTVNATRALLDAHEATGATVLCALDLAGEDVSRYGVIDGEAEGSLVRVRRVVEKPPRGTEPSHLVSIGRFVYSPAIWEPLRRGLATHRDGEYYPIDAFNELAVGGEVVAVPVPGRVDTGTPLGLLQASIDEALRRPDLGPALRAWLRERL